MESTRVFSTTIGHNNETVNDGRYLDLVAGNFNTNVVGLAFYRQLFDNLSYGSSSAIVVMLIIAIIPIMVFQVRQFRREEASR